MIKTKFPASCWLPLTVLFALFFLSSFTEKQSIPLAGKWRFQADPTDQGITNKWFEAAFNEEVVLPGSMNGNLKGDNITLETKWTGSIYDSSFYFNPRLAKYRQPGNIKIPFWLTPAKHYVGAAWYQKDVTIPANWSGQRIVLFLERAHISTQVWVDSKPLGSQNSLVAPHEYDLSSALAPGKHRITIRVDNRLKPLNVGPDSHSVTDHTGGNWNGMIGKLRIDAGSPVYFSDIQVYPDLANKRARVEIKVHATPGKNVSGEVKISAKSFNSGVSHQVSPVASSFQTKGDSITTLTIDLPMGEKMQTWDEFDSALYSLKASLTDNMGHVESSSVQFGMREFSIEGRQFKINGRPVFLRGTVNNAEFPLTGYPAMDVPAWERIFRIARTHGLNHMRFHSWCPPEAAFIAADLTGFYLQPEGPSWPNHGVSIGRGAPIDQYLYDETNRMNDRYGNYASFCMLSAGNEPAGNQVQYLVPFVDYWKKKDSRHVYTGMSVGGSWPIIPNAAYQVRGGVRGLTWDRRPESLSDFSAGIASFSVPFIAHEMGQWCVFPDFKEIQKYTGSYKARNMELFREDLNDRGMGSQAEDFLKASGKLQALCYKAEIEKALRTPGYGGFQLLGLLDFPGQGTALVGVLNAFWDEKGYISAKQFNRFCNSTVPLAGFPKFVFSNIETLEVKASVFHSGKSPLKNAVMSWTVRDEAGKVISAGKFAPKTVENGNGIPVGDLKMPLLAITKAAKLNLELAVDGTAFANDWDFWVYPETLPETGKDEILYTTEFNEAAKKVLEAGGSVFLNASGRVVKGKEVSMSFTPVFWNTSWFKMRPPHVTGILVQDKSPAFAAFPTSFHSDLQWWEIVNRAQVMILEDFPAGFTPLVQPIDTWFLNRRLALIYEARVGKGKMIVSSANLAPDRTNSPAARQLFYSLKKYMASPAFNPRMAVEQAVIEDVFINPSKEKFTTFTKDSPDELKPNSNQNKPKN